MEEGKKIAFFAAGALLGAAFLLAWVSDSVRESPRMTAAFDVARAPVTDADSLAEPPAADALGNYSPQWIHVSHPRRTLTLGEPVFPLEGSWGVPELDAEESAETSSFNPAAYRSDIEDGPASLRTTEPRDGYPSGPVAGQSANTLPSNNAELREKLRRGK